LATIKADYGGMDTYLHDVIGLSKTDRDDLQRLYLEEAG
jgi:protein tyrosine/serine phosphatase